MKLHFDSKQEYQINAVKTVVDLFDGQTLNKGEFEFSLSTVNNSILFSENGFGNNLTLTEEQILKNLQNVESINQLPISEKLEKVNYKEIDSTNNEILSETGFYNFTVEMETGTGKTYVYLRTIYELNRVYGFTKFIIVVPSIAIREGVLKNLEITHDHFQSLYERVPVNFNVYDSRRLPQLKSFATSNSIQIFVINIDSFAKDTNIINQYRDSTNGKKPIEFIQSVNPIVILDEPQNMETDIRKKAIANLNPCFTLRYSATHKNLYNLVYKLDPVKAYDMGLVKQIEVDSVFSENDFNQAFIKLEDIKVGKAKISAIIKIDCETEKGIIRKNITVDNKHFDLFELSNHRTLYRNLIVTEINAEDNFIELSDGEKIYKGESKGALRDDILKIQIQKTIEEHFSKEEKLRQKGIKVLSLFFIDRVANYRDYGEGNDTIKGKFAEWFEEIFYRYQQKNPLLIPYKPEEVHNGYFAQDKSGKYKDSSGETKADDDTYHLIMKDKERLLDANEPLRFIFSHSALREGWDNPNVFQICTLNETASELKKRQEIGRGLRLCVDQSGLRIHDKHTNKLTVIANESYEDFARKLQTEIEEETGTKFTGRIKEKRKRVNVKLKNKYLEDTNFLDLWNRIKHQTIYRVLYSTEDLIKKAVVQIKVMPEVKKPIIKTTKTAINIVGEGVTGYQTSFSVHKVENAFSEIPDIISYIQQKTELTRSTIIRIIRESGRLEDALINPQIFIDQVVYEIKNVLNNLMIEGIKYLKIAGQEYEMRLFEDGEIETYLDNLRKVKNQEKTLYNYVPFDSKVEEEFATDCENNPNVEFYVKLPSGFKIKTPIGDYNPDWALIFKNESKLYFVAETKATTDDQELRNKELMKIKCGKAHFEEFEDVTFKQVKKLSELLD